MATLPTTNVLAADDGPAGQGNLFRRLRDFLSRNHQPHEFTSDAFKASDLGIADPFPVTHLYLLAKFPKLVALLRLLILVVLGLYFSQMIISLILFILIVTPLLFVLAKVLQYGFNVGDGSMRWVSSKIVVLAVCLPPQPVYAMVGITTLT
jgi:hypothetical protein